MHASTLRRKSPDSDDDSCGNSPRSQASSCASNPTVASQASAIVDITSSSERATPTDANTSNTPAASEDGNKRGPWTVADGGDGRPPSNKRRKLVHKADKKAAYDALSTPTDVIMSDGEDSASEYSCDSLSDEVSISMFDGDNQTPEDSEDEDITLPRDIDWYSLVGDSEGDLNITVASDERGVEVVTLIFGEDVPAVAITRPDEPEDPWIACRNCVNWRYAQNPRFLLTPGAYIVGDELPEDTEDDTGDDLDEVEGDYILEEFLRTLEEELRQGAAEEPRDPEHASGREGAVIRDICDDYD